MRSIGLICIGALLAAWVYFAFFTAEGPLTFGIAIRIVAGAAALIAIMYSLIRWHLAADARALAAIHSMDDAEFARLSVVAMMLRRSGHQLSLALAALTAAAIISVVLSGSAALKRESLVAFAACAALGFAVSLRHGRLASRIRSGTYGSTRDEAAAIIRFALENAEEITPKRPGGPTRPLITREDLAALDSGRRLVPTGGIIATGA
jgi:hypothetical protein